MDDALGLEKVTIRLQKELVEEFKMIAKEEGLGYQPLIRQVLTNYLRTRKSQRPLVAR
jgi:predicted DNA binding CopG/RHH family protein